ncbi:MAG: DUF998 domain-containing protein, partial [Candidatus Saccharimonadales bacterium]
GLQYFLAQLIVGSRFSPHYSLAHNTISDLGNTSCSAFNNRPICSPLHLIMNVSFIILGITLVAGSMLLYYRFKQSRKNTLGFGLYAVGGIGVVMVGLFPENTVSALHGIGAALPFLIGNMGIVLLGFSLKLPKLLLIYTMLTGLIALIALGFYATSYYLGLGEGGIERVVAYPQTIWMVVLGIYLLMHPQHPRKGLVA